MLQSSPGIPPDPPRDRPHLQPVKTSQYGLPARVAGCGQKATAANLRWKFGKAKRHHLDNEVGTRSPLAWRQSKQGIVTINKLHQTSSDLCMGCVSLPNMFRKLLHQAPCQTSRGKLLAEMGKCWLWYDSQSKKSCLCTSLCCQGMLMSLHGCKEAGWTWITSRRRWPRKQNFHGSAIKHENAPTSGHEP